MGTTQKNIIMNKKPINTINKGKFKPKFIPNPKPVPKPNLPKQEKKEDQ